MAPWSFISPGTEGLQIDTTPRHICKAQTNIQRYSIMHGMAALEWLAHRQSLIFVGSMFVKYSIWKIPLKMFMLTRMDLSSVPAGVLLPNICMGLFSSIHKTNS